MPLPRVAPGSERRGTRFFWRLCAGFVGLVLVTSLAIGALIDSRVRADLQDSILSQLTAEAAYLAELAEPVLEGDAPAPVLQRQAERISLRTGSRLTVLDAQGTVIVDTYRLPGSLDNHLARPEIRQALEHGAGQAERASTTLGVDLLYLALPVEADGRVLGFCRASMPLMEIGPRASRLRRIVLVGACGAALIGVLLALVYARRVTAPLAEMTAAVEATARGEFTRVQVPLDDDEIGRLGVAFNLMASVLHDRMATITANHNTVLAILSSMDEGVVAVDGEERVLHMNAVAGELLGRVPEQSTGRPMRELTGEGDISQALANARESGESTRVEVRLQVGTTVEERVLQLHASPLMNARGERSGAVVVVNDLTELRRLEDVRRDFVANVSHELKTPLAAIRAMVEMLVDAPELPAQKQLDFHERVLRQTDRLATLVQDLLTLARLESQQPTLAAAPCDLVDAIALARARFLPQAEKQGLTLTTRVPATPVTLAAEEEDLRQILDNLLDNAIKYTAVGGHVEVLLHLSEDGASAQLEVVDSGVGIEPLHLDRIFERFYRVDKARSRELGGTGLGLAIVKHLALSLGGTVDVESAPGQGTRFYVEFPLAPPPA